YPGASPEVVNRTVSAPIERAVQGIAGLEGTSATSSTGMSIVLVEFKYGTNLSTAEQKTQQAISRLNQVLPSEVAPNIISGSLDDFPILQLAVSATAETGELANLLETQVIPEI